jgi:arginyl-tRNA synthetase
MKLELEQVVAAAVKELYDVDVAIELTRPDEQFGDYATNVALQLSKQLGRNPREIAGELAERLSGRNAGIAGVEVAGPGFLNLKLTDEALIRGMSAEAPKTLAEKTVLVEYSDPNPFKPLHAGHLYTTLVGDMIARLIENAGAKTVRLNFGGDVGLHVGKSMWAIMRWLGSDISKLDTIETTERPAWLGERYVEGNNAYEDDEKAKVEIIESNKQVYALHESNDKESDFAKVYWKCREWSYDYFKLLYKQLDVVAFDRFIPESEVAPLGLKTVREQLSSGVYRESDGAVIFPGDEHGLHTRVFINREGIPTYETKDVGLSLSKWQDYHFDESVIITANEQAQYMQVVIASIAQFAPEPAERTKHLTHGVVKLSGGVKMSSRKGNIVSALDILKSAREAGEASGTNPSEETILAAVKYAFAKNRVGGDIIYDPAESVAIEGNSGPYLQYAHARARSILAKASEVAKVSSTELEPGERSLARKLGEHSEVIEKATAELMPHHICTYLYELAQTFNSFYEKNRVIDDPRQATRLHLVRSYAKTLCNGLELLGIKAPERM